MVSEARAGSDWAFLVGALVWVVPFAVSGFYWLQSRERYGRLYRRKTKDPAVPLPEELNALVYERPWEAMRIGLSARKELYAPQSDPELEAARRHVRRGQRCTVVIMCVGALAPDIATLLAEWR